MEEVIGLTINTSKSINIEVLVAVEKLLSNEKYTQRNHWISSSSELLTIFTLINHISTERNPRYTRLISVNAVKKLCSTRFYFKGGRGVYLQFPKVAFLDTICDKIHNPIDC